MSKVEKNLTAIAIRSAFITAIFASAKVWGWSDEQFWFICIGLMLGMMTQDLLGLWEKWNE